MKTTAQKPMPDEINSILRGYQPARTLLTAVELDVFSAIGRGATAQDVAKKIKSSPRGTEILLNALAALGFVNKTGEVFRNSGIADEFLREGAKNDSRLPILHTANQWRRWSEMTDCVRRGKPADLKPMKSRGAGWRNPFIAAMHRNAASRAPRLAAALDLRGVRSVLDVGGGSGAFSVAFARANPAIRATVFDLPNVTPLTREYVGQSDVAKRVRTRDGDYLKDDFGEGYDLVLFSAVLHINSPAENKRLLKKAFRALNSGGRVVIHDSVMDRSKTKPASGALFALNMLVSTHKGNSYSGAEYGRWLKDAGFSGLQTIPLPGPSGLMIGRKS
ncbi:MAG: methyltransferase domain-containing protein [Deltaproteobacteria bacterium]|nr:methyltransferase domain-containing protein [Deltaproteobacteria bacterium]